MKSIFCRPGRHTKSKVKFGVEYPFEVRKVPWDELWHVMYYARTVDGLIYETYNRVKQSEALEASKHLLNQYGVSGLPKELW